MALDRTVRSTVVDIPGPLPKFERFLAWTIWIAHSVMAFVIAAWVSSGKLRIWLESHHWVKNSSYTNSFQMDLSDPEWLYYRETILHLLLSYSIHSALILLVRKTTSSYSELLIVIIGFACQIHMTSMQCIVVLYSFAAVVYLATCQLKGTFRATVAWTLCILFITKSVQYIPFTVGGQIFYREFNVYLYGAFKILNYNLHICANPTNHPPILESLQYFAYLPYSMTLIVTYEDFAAQLRLPVANFKFFRSAFRLIFWFFALEMLLHVVHVNAIFNGPPDVLKDLNVYEVAAVSYVSGQLFYLKYVIIFGVPAFFASFDGLKPPNAPICISRVSLYSRMWRYFDNGLYSFLKTHVYIPVMKKPLPLFLSCLRNISALIAVFGVVLAWHGTRTHYICWVFLSAAELIIERIGYSFWKLESTQQIRMKLGEHCCRRIIATTMLLTVTPGIFGVFFFLGQEGIGQAILDKVVIQGVHDVSTGNFGLSPVTSGFGFLHILILGYFFNNVCLDIEIYYES